MADSIRWLDWFNNAEKDLNGAKILYQYDGDFSLVAFHCQQAIEKYLKGYILKHKQEISEGHSLIYLCKQTAEFDTSAKRLLKDCAYVNQFYIETRYPSDTPMELTNDEAKECIRIAEKVQKYVSKAD